MAKTTKEYRVVCARFGERGHAQHTWQKKDRKKAEQSVLDNNHHAEMLKSKKSNHFYIGEAPYRIQVREVTAWTEDSSSSEDSSSEG